MDNTFSSNHVSDFEAIIMRKRSRLPFKPDRVTFISPGGENHFFLTKMFKKAADKKVKKFAAKTAAKSGLSEQEKQAFVKQVEKSAQPVTTKAARSAALVTGGALLSAGGFALAPLLAGGAAASGAAAGGSAAAAKTAGGLAAAGGLTKPIKKALTGVKSKVVEFKDTKAGLAAQEILQSLPESVKQNLKEKGTAILGDIVGDRTAAELLPKTKAQKELEASVVQSQGKKGLPLIRPTEILVIGGIILLVIAMIIKARS